MFNQKKKEIESLKRRLDFWMKSCDDLQEIINKLKEENQILKTINNKLNDQIIDMKKISQENEIMRKYYKVDEELSSDVQAKVLSDLRLHDMEFKIIQEKLNDCKQQLFNIPVLSLPYPYPRWC